MAVAGCGEGVDVAGKDGATSAGVATAVSVGRLASKRPVVTTTRTASTAIVAVRMFIQGSLFYIGTCTAGYVERRV